MAPRKARGAMVIPRCRFPSSPDTTLDIIMESSNPKQENWAGPLVREDSASAVWAISLLK